jgi:hypothetical protein
MKHLADKDYNHSTDRTPAGNSGLAKVAVQSSADTFVVNQSLVLRINICGENRHLRQARKRYAELLGETPEKYFLRQICFLSTNHLPLT